MKKLVVILSLLMILTSCFGKDADVEPSTNTGSELEETNTWAVDVVDNIDVDSVGLTTIEENGSDITASGNIVDTTASGATEEQIFGDIDALLEEIITEAEGNGSK